MIKVNYRALGMLSTNCYVVENPDSQKVLIVDDLIATGGTTKAMIRLVERLGGEVAGILVLIELAGLKGREAVKGYRLDAAITYPGK